MSKVKNNFVCQQCGAAFSKWSGRCEQCNAWNSITEEHIPHDSLRHSKIKTDPTKFFQNLSLHEPNLETQNRIQTHISEFNQVCGGGLVPGSVLLLGGDPGIGKSTLLLQIIAGISANHTCAYVSGEEALSQIHLRAKRLGVEKTPLHLASSTNLDETLSALEKMPDLKIAIIDSIQTISLNNIDSPAGTVSQVRSCALELTRSAKKHGYCVILVGHVTKEGTLAGPRVLEHMVDTVLYFEGEKSYDYRLLRAVKNRFGATDEIGVFTMGEQGLQEVTNPSSLFLSQNTEAVPGCAVFAGIEGTRPIFVDIQALVAPSYFPSPKRTAVGWDTNRLAMILAVLETRCGISFANKDVYINVSGGLKINEPAVDLAVSAALISAHKNVPINRHMAFCGEISLTGEIRPVSYIDKRAKEAEKLGFISLISSTSETGKSQSLQHLRHLLPLLQKHQA